MKSGIRAAIIGFGGMGQRHYQAYQKIGVEVVAISDLYPEKIAEIVPHLSKQHIYKNYRELLEHEDIDIISVVTNGPTHSEVTIRASECGVKNIFCEKPMATNLMDAHAVIDICKKNNTRIAVNHIRRWSSNYTRLRQQINAGVIGKIRHLYFSCGSTGLGNFAIHFFDTARYLTGHEPMWAMGFIDRTGTPNPRGSSFSDPGGYGIIQFDDGSRFFIDTSEDTGVQYVFQIVGTHGRIHIDELNDFWLIRSRTEKTQKMPLTRYGADMEEISFVSDSKFDIIDLTSRGLEELISGRPISSTESDGFKSIEMVIALHLSDEQGNNKISFPLVKEYYKKDVKIA